MDVQPHGWEPISKTDAQTILRAHNCFRDNWGNGSFYIERQGCAEVRLLFHRTDGKWFAPKSKHLK